MRSAVCTLFEGSYHYGLAALTNSLHKSGFRGDIYAGYRGDLPAWGSAACPISVAGTAGATSLAVADGLRIIFLPLGTDYHLTNYKPDFMLALFDGPASGADALFYVDPDVCVVERWGFFEDWVSCGVALCEDVNSPLPAQHPRRVGWRRYFEPRGLVLRFRGVEYVNGGFVGVRSGDRQFLELWKQAMSLMAEELGSLTLALVDKEAYKSAGFANCFDRTDQDALNAAIEGCTTSISVVGQDAMAFRPGSAILPHALGSDKPWQRNYFRTALRGIAPRMADKAFWANVLSPIAVYTSRRAALKRLDLFASAALGRFFRRV
jgi:hypothetical protein